MSKTIVFTPENRSRLEQLYLSLSFSGLLLSGKFGANNHNPYDLLNNVSLNTLRNMRIQLKTEIEKEESTTDEWEATEYQQQKLREKKKWSEFLHLIIGHRLAEEQKAKTSKALHEKKKTLEELVENNKSPKERIDELKAEIAQMEGNDASATPATPPVS